MAPLTQRDKRTIRIAGIGIAIYLILFFGWSGWKKLESRRADFQELLAKAQREEQDMRAYENKVLMFQKLREAYHLDPARLPKESLVAEASAAIQNAAREGGIALGPVRETPGRASGRELASIQLDGAGPLPAALGLIHKIQTMGYPVIIDSLSLTQDPAKPGMLKISATLVILNFEAWKTGEAPNA